MKVYKGVLLDKVIIDGEKITINRVPMNLDEVYHVEMTEVTRWKNGKFSIFACDLNRGGTILKISVYYSGGKENTFQELFNFLSVVAKKNKERLEVEHSKDVSFKSYSTECLGCSAPVTVTKKGEACEYCGTINAI